MKSCMLHNSAEDKQLTGKDEVELMCAYSHKCTVFLLGSAGCKDSLSRRKQPFRNN